MDDRGVTPPLTRAWAEVGASRTLTLRAVDLWTIELPFVAPVVTARGVHRRRPLVMVRLRALEGDRAVDGWGECAALADTTYDVEDVARSFAALEHELVPALVEEAVRGRHQLPPPSVLTATEEATTEVPLAFAALEMAVADAHLRSDGKSLATVLGVEGRAVPLGAVVGQTGSLDDLVGEVGRLLGAGFTRVKLKVGPGWDLAPVAAVRAHAPDLLLQVDANGTYREPDADHLLELDEFGLLCLEQPFDRGDLDAHVRLAGRMKTPICLDESLTSPDVAARAVSTGACSVVCVKPSRLGGLGAALRVIESCAALGVPMWMGGMYESGFARGVNTTLAALPAFAWPGDLSPSRTYLDEDLVPAPSVSRRPPRGVLEAPVPQGPGMGPPPDLRTIERFAVRHRTVAVPPP